MAAPVSARPLPSQLPNANAPLCVVEGEVDQQLRDSTGAPVTGKIELFGFITPAWKYLMALFAQTSPNINPNFTLTAGVSYSQTQQQQLIDQVALLSKQLGRSS